MQGLARFRSLVITLSLLMTPIAGAQTAMQSAGASAPAAGSRLFDLASLDPARILPPPPAPDSIPGGADLAAVLQVQAWRTPAQVEWAKRVDAADFFALFAADDLLGPTFTRENHPRFAALFTAIANESRPVNAAAKKLFARPRPFVTEGRVLPCVERSAGESYPSGHAQAARLRAEVLAEIFPQKREALFVAADRIAWGRVIAGVHYPSDLIAGRMLAQAIVAELKKSPAFRAEIERCREEFERVATREAVLSGR